MSNAKYNEVAIKVAFLAIYAIVEVKILLLGLDGIRNNSSGTIGEAMFDDILKNGLFFIIFTGFSFLLASILMKIYIFFGDYLKSSISNKSMEDILDN